MSKHTTSTAGETPQAEARLIINGLLRSMSEDLRFRDHGHAQNWYITDSVLSSWRHVLSLRNWASENSPEVNMPGLDNLLRSMEKDIQDTVERAYDEARFWDAMTVAIEMLTKNNKPLPAPLSDLAVKAMRAEVTRPAKRGRRANDDRDVMITLAVHQIITRFPQITATKNEATEGDPSACEIVADILSEKGIVLSARSVEKVWAKNHSMRGLKRP